MVPEMCVYVGGCCEPCSCDEAELIAILIWRLSVRPPVRKSKVRSNRFGKCLQSKANSLPRAPAAISCSEVSLRGKEELAELRVRVSFHRLLVYCKSVAVKVNHLLAVVPLKLARHLLYPHKENLSFLAYLLLGTAYLATLYPLLTRHPSPP